MIGAELVHAFEDELAFSLDDFLHRRCMAGLMVGRGRELVAPALELARTRLGWDETRIESERLSSGSRLPAN